MEFKILGPLEVCEGDRRLSCRGQKQRLLLGILLLNANEAVSSDRLTDALWGERPPRGAAKALQMHVSQLRDLLEPERTRGASGRILLTRPPGYELPGGARPARPARLRAGRGQLEGGGGGRPRRRGSALAARGPVPLARSGTRGPELRGCPAGRHRASRGAAPRRARGAVRRGPGARSARRADRRARGSRSPSSRSASDRAASSCWRSTARAGRPRRSRATATPGAVLVEELGLEPGRAAEGARGQDPRSGSDPRPTPGGAWR